MGKMTKQWLNRGQGLRDRSFRPVTVTVSARNPSDDWSIQNEIAVKLTASRENHEYQELYLTAAEAEKVIPNVLSACGEAVRLHLTEELLEKLSDADLHKVLARVFKKRIG